MDGFEKVFQHRPEYRIIVCKTCKFAVVPDQVYTHLQTHRPRMPTILRRSITELYQTLGDVARSVEEVVYPDPEEMRVPG